MADNGFIPPVPFAWLQKFISAIPPRRGTSPTIGICSALALYYAHKITKNNTVKLTRNTQIKFGLNYRNTRRALKVWEAKGFIKIEWANGQALTVTLLELPPSTSS